jgi:hypothetical protein
LAGVTATATPITSKARAIPWTVALAAVTVRMRRLKMRPPTEAALCNGGAMYKRASLRTGGSNTSGAHRNTGKTTKPNTPKQKDVRPHPLSVLRKSWIPYVENYIRMDEHPKYLPPKFRKEVEATGSLRSWLKWVRRLHGIFDNRFRTNPSEYLSLQSHLQGLYHSQGKTSSGCASERRPA